MATVKFSKELSERIIANARSVYKPQLDKAIQNTKWEWFDVVYNRAYAQYLPHMNALPNEFFTIQDEVHILEFGNVNMDAKIILPSARKFPKENIPDLLIRYNSWRTSEFKITDDEQWGTVGEEIYAYKQAINKITNASEEFVESVRTIIITYPTLAPALRAWPPLWELLPDTAREAHKRINEKVKTEIVLDLDLSKLTSAITMHKLTK